MDIHVLDDSFRRVEVVDTYISMVWAERFFEDGDFELEMKPTREMRSLFSTGRWIVIPTSYRVMRVDVVEDKSSDEGTVLSIRGPSMETILSERIAASSMVGLSTLPVYTKTGFPIDVTKSIFNDFCATTPLSSSDAIPHFSAAAFLPTGERPPTHESEKFEFEVDTVHANISMMCQRFNLGYRLVRNETNPLSPTVHFDIYAGNNRTTGQTIFPAVIFDQKLENLSDVSELTSVSGHKNVAYVFGNKGALEVYADGVDPTVAGFKRRVLIVKADDITLNTGAPLTEALTRRGKEELSKFRSVIALDGEISQTSEYKYGVDYHLGDVVEVRGSNGLANHMRVTEQIFVSDENGDRSYPTLTLEQVVTPGSWDSVSGNIRWYDVATETTWATF